ncbi:MAG: ABC transporter permease [Clostridiales bacterium]|nr:ABC transporter permease [Clostridiales bacterium]
MLKTFRDIRETIGSFISILIIIFIGCFFFAGVAEGSNAMTELVDDYYAAQHIASARAEYMYVNSTAVDEIAADENIQKAAGYDTFNAKMRYNDVRYDITLTTLTDGIDEPHILSGRLPENGHKELMIDTVFADAHNVHIGDVISVDINVLKSIDVNISENENVQYNPDYDQVSHDFTVCGIYHSTDVIYKVNTLNTAAQPEEFATALVNYGVIHSYTDTTAVCFNGMIEPVFTYDKIPDGISIYSGIKVIGDVKRAEELFKAYNMASEETLKYVFQNPSKSAGMYMYMLERENFPAVAAYDNLNGTIAALAAVLPLIFFIVAAAITIISLSKTVENQRMQIGIMQALGISKGGVYFSYIFYALFACVVGGIAGGVVGTFFVPYLLDILYKRQFSMPPTPWHVSGLFLVLGVVISAALACLSAFASCYKTLRVKPAHAMRPKPPKKTKRILAERWTGLWKRLGFGAKMNLRNMFLHKTRMLLSSVGIIGCVALLIGLIGLKDNMQFSFTRYDAMTGYDMTIVTSVAVDITDRSIYEDIRGAEGAEYMRNLTFVPDFSGRFTFGGKTADLTVMAIPTYGDETKYYFADADCVKLYTDVKGKNRLILTSSSFVLPKTLADELGCKAGDIVNVSGYSLDNRAVEFDIEVTAVVQQYFDQKVYCAYDVFANKGVGLLADTSYATVRPDVDINEALDALKQNDVVRDVKVFQEETFKSMQKKMSLLDYAVIIFVVGAAALAIAVIYNITATNLKERTREMATLMVLGYKSHETAGMIIVENMVITLIGCILGLPLGYGLMYWLVDITSSFNVFISGFLTWYVAIGCVSMTFAFSLIATLLLNRKIKRISMVEALKSVE